MISRMSGFGYIPGVLFHLVSCLFSSICMYIRNDTMRRIVLHGIWNCLRFGRAIFRIVTRNPFIQSGNYKTNGITSTYEESQFFWNRRLRWTNTIFIPRHCKNKMLLDRLSSQNYATDRDHEQNRINKMVEKMKNVDKIKIYNHSNWFFAAIFGFDLRKWINLAHCTPADDIWCICRFWDITSYCEIRFVQYLYNTRK